MAKAIVWTLRKIDGSQTIKGLVVKPVKFIGTEEEYIEKEERPLLKRWFHIDPIYSKYITSRQVIAVEPQWHEPEFKVIDW